MGHRWVRDPDIMETPVEGDLYLVVPSTDNIIFLNPIAAGIWRLLSEPHSLDEIVTVFATAFPDSPVDPQEINKAITSLVNAQAIRLID